MCRSLVWGNLWLIRGSGHAGAQCGPEPFHVTWLKLGLGHVAGRNARFCVVKRPLEPRSSKWSLYVFKKSHWETFIALGCTLARHSRAVLRSLPWRWWRGSSPRTTLAEQGCPAALAMARPVNADTKCKTKCDYWKQMVNLENDSMWFARPQCPGRGLYFWWPWRQKTLEDCGKLSAVGGQNNMPPKIHVWVSNQPWCGLPGWKRTWRMERIASYAGTANLCHCLWAGGVVCWRGRQGWSSWREIHLWEDWKT